METTTVYLSKDIRKAWDAGFSHGAGLSEDDFQKWLYMNGIGSDILKEDWERAQQNRRVHKISGTKPITMNAVIKVVSRMSGVSRRRLRRAKDRNPNLIVARHLIYYLCYHHVPESIENISHSIGRKSHSTVTAAVQRMKESMEVDKFAREQMLLVYAALESRGYNTSYYVTPPSAVHYLSSTMRPRNLFKNYTPNN